MNRDCSIRSLGTALRDGTISATEVTAAALRRIREGDETINAFVVVDEVGALGAARQADAEIASGIDRGALHGIPVGVKDIVDVAGLPTTCGSASSFGVRRAGADAEIVARLRDAGAIVIGKNTLHEFAYGATGDRSLHGPSRNPLDRTRMTGGSSGGGAAAVAAGMAPLAVGTDTVGSVRVPAALCGVVGFKPAFDALSTSGVRPCAPSLDHVGLLTGNCDDAALAFEALRGSPSNTVASGATTVAWVSPREIAPVDERIERATFALLTAAGLSPTAEVTVMDGRSLLETAMTVQRKEAFDVHAAHLEHDAHLIDDEVLARLRSGREISDADYAAACLAREAFGAFVAAQLARHQILALPSVAVTAPVVGQRTVEVEGRSLDVRAALLGLTAPWNLAGTPAITVPAGTLDGLPIGIQLLTAPGREALLLGAAARVQAAQQSAGRAP